MSWRLVGKLHRRNSFAGYPIESLHRDLRKLAPYTDITDYGVSPATNKFLKGKLKEWAKKNTWRKGRSLETAVAMEMLMYSPCDIANATDFCVYVREDNNDIVRTEDTDV